MLKFIGNGSAFNVERGNNSAYYIKGDKMLLIDCGSNIFERIIKNNLLDGINEVHVLVTHTHADHVGSLADLILYMFYAKREIGKPKVYVYADYALNVEDFLILNGVITKTHYVAVLTFIGNTHFESFNVFDDVNYTPFFTTHVDELESTGFILSIDDKCIYYSGDTSHISQFDIDALKDNVYDYMYVDTCKADYEGNVHLSLRKLTELIPEYLRHKVYCMHLDAGFDVTEAKGLGFNVTKNIEEEV